MLYRYIFFTFTTLSLTEQIEKRYKKIKGKSELILPLYFIRHFHPVCFVTSKKKHTSSNCRHYNREAENVWLRTHNKYSQSSIFLLFMNYGDQTDFRILAWRNWLKAKMLTHAVLHVLAFCFVSTYIGLCIKWNQRK